MISRVMATAGVQLLAGTRPRLAESSGFAVAVEDRAGDSSKQIRLGRELCAQKSRESCEDDCLAGDGIHALTIRQASGIVDAACKTGLEQIFHVLFARILGLELRGPTVGVSFREDAEALRQFDKTLKKFVVNLFLFVEVTAHYKTLQLCPIKLPPMMIAAQPMLTKATVLTQFAQRSIWRIGNDTTNDSAAMPMIEPAPKTTT